MITEARRIEKKLLRQQGLAIRDFGMISEGDRIMVCLSGGKDSFSMLSLLADLQRRAPIRFELLAVHLDQQQPGYPRDVMPDYLGGLGIPFRIVRQDTYSVVKRLVPDGKTMCSVCSRLRRGILYNTAVAEGCSKIALGHHADDLIQTLLLNLMFVGSVKAMSPMLRSDDGRNTVIRPLAYCWEKDIEAYAAHQGYPIIPCDMCGSQEHLRRKRIKRLLEQLGAEIPDLKRSIFGAMGNVVPSHLLDRKLHDFGMPQGALEEELD